MKPELGICTWSLENKVARVTHVMKEAGLKHLHLEVSAAEAFADAIAANEWVVGATMTAFPQEDYSTLETIKATGGLVPDSAWPAGRARALTAIKTTAALRVPFLSTHVGFIDHTDPGGFRTMCDRVYELADAALAAGIMLLMETGQETAEDLAAFLDTLEHPALGVNFDPANMILYGKGDPIAAVQTLAPWIKHVHLKDATASPVAGEWGEEVPWGEGDVEAAAFMRALAEIQYTGAAAIEREAGTQREADLLAAANSVGELAWT